MEIPFKYVGEEKYFRIFEIKKLPCPTCKLPINTEIIKINKCLVTYLEISKKDNITKFTASLHGHKILDESIENECRWEWC